MFKKILLKKDGRNDSIVKGTYIEDSTFPVPMVGEGGLQLSVTPVQGDLMPSSGLYWHQYDL